MEKGRNRKRKEKGTGSKWEKGMGRKVGRDVKKRWKWKEDDAVGEV